MLDALVAANDDGPIMRDGLRFDGRPVERWLQGGVR